MRLVKGEDTLGMAGPFEKADLGNLISQVRNGVNVGLGGRYKILALKGGPGLGRATL